MQGVGSGLPDAALPAECHLVLRPDVPLRSISPPGLPLLLPQHCPGAPHHHIALHPLKKGLSLCSCTNMQAQESVWRTRMCDWAGIFYHCLQGQKDYGRCLRLSQCCVTSSSSSPDSVKGAALRSNSRYTSSQSRRATANRQVHCEKLYLWVPLCLPDSVLTVC